MNNEEYKKSFYGMLENDIYKKIFTIMSESHIYLNATKEKIKGLKNIYDYCEIIKQDIDNLKCCGNCIWVVKHHYGGLFCNCNQSDTNHNERCGAWELNKGD